MIMRECSYCGHCGPPGEFREVRSRSGGYVVECGDLARCAARVPADPKWWPKEARR